MPLVQLISTEYLDGNDSKSKTSRGKRQWRTCESRRPQASDAQLEKNGRKSNRGRLGVWRRLGFIVVQAYGFSGFKALRVLRDLRVFRLLVGCGVLEVEEVVHGFQGYLGL